MKNARYFRGAKGRMVTSPKTAPGGQQSYPGDTELKINPANLELYVRKEEEGAREGEEAERGGGGQRRFQ